MAEPLVVTFAALLRRLRTQAGLSQEELAEAAGVGVRTVSDLERGVAQTARKDTARLLAGALGLAGAERDGFEAVARGRAASPSGPVSLPGGVAAATQTLPRDVAFFTGREAELEQLVGAMAAAGLSGMAGIHAVGGMAGVGKTALAVHAAHQLATQFPDGQIFLPLHGHTPGQRPVDPADALASLLQTVGVAPGQMPAGVEARMALWRDRLAGRRLLLLLDDAAGSDQVRPLLPGGQGSLVLVTSRRHLTALEDAHAVSLETLPAAEAAELLTRLAARPALDPADPAVAEITRLCGCLPLAVGMLARQLHHHPSWTAAEVADDLAAAHDRLELLHAENVSVAAAFDLSYADLTPGQQRLFRRLGLHPGPETDAYAAAALDGTDLATARRHLEGLYDHYLIAEPARGRYRPHDLIREHARTLAATDPAADRDAAAGRLLDYYQHTTATAQRLLSPWTQPGPADPAPPPATAPDLGDRDRALAWARSERANLHACLDQVTRTGQHTRMIALTSAMADLLLRDGPWVDALAHHTAALEATQHIGDQLGEAGARNDIGAVLIRTGDYPAATRALEKALSLYRALGEPLGQANTLSLLGVVRRVTGNYPGATLALEEALGTYRDLDDTPGHARALLHLGDLRAETADYPAAATALWQALDLYHGLGDRLGEAHALSDLGYLSLWTGDHLTSDRVLRQALDAYRDLGDQLGQANTLRYQSELLLATGDHLAAARALRDALSLYRGLGERRGQALVLHGQAEMQRLTGDYPGAALTLQQALDAYRDLDDTPDEAHALNDLGTIHLARGDPHQAQACHQQALDLAVKIASPQPQAHALAGLGRCALAAGDPAAAQGWLRQALEILRQIGDPGTASVAAELDTITKTTHRRQGTQQPPHTRR